MRWMCLIVIGFGWGCEDDAVDDATETTETTEADTESDPSCHHDCFGWVECRDGVATRWAHAPVPCAAWTGACPVAETFTCARGCAAEPPADAREARFACEELRPKQVGDPCSAPADCEPQVATIDGDVVSNVYLACDLALGTCVARTPPVVDDWLAPCGQTAPFGAAGAEYGYVESEACASGLCLILEQTDCVAQGCTSGCDSDDDCPVGATCTRDFQNWTVEGGTGHHAVCKPGPPNRVGIDLVCPPQ